MSHLGPRRGLGQNLRLFVQIKKLGPYLGRMDQPAGGEAKERTMVQRKGEKNSTGGGCGLALRHLLGKNPSPQSTRKGDHKLAGGVRTPIGKEKQVGSFRQRGEEKVGCENERGSRLKSRDFQGYAITITALWERFRKRETKGPRMLKAD